MASFSINVNQKIHLIAHPVNGATPPVPVDPASIPAPGLVWSIPTQSGGMLATFLADADKMGATVQAVAPGTATVKWVAPNGVQDLTTITVTIDPIAIAAGTTTADPPEPK